jgi:phenylacetate-coenzyme A ligase PaaK-like adenylate-forming protein
MAVTTSIGTGFEELRAQVQRELSRRLPEQIRRLGWSRAELEVAQRDALRALLAHAVETSPFHQRRLHQLDPSRFELADLDRVPVMTKAEMMGSLDDVFTDRRLTRRLVEQALERTRAEPVPILDAYTAIATGGVSGTRGVFVFDSDAVVGYLSSLTRPLMARLQPLGGPPREGLVMGFVAAASAVHATRSAIAWTAGGTLPVHPIAVPVTLPLPEIVGRLNDVQPPLLYGYASILVRLAAELRTGRLHIAPRSVTSTSETLTPDMRRAIRDAFGAPIVDVYGSSEGLIGVTAPDDDTFVFNSDFCIVELVDAENHPVPAGVPSAKVLLTNLYNRTQPLIRYELGDSFVRQPDALEHGHLRATVRGRADEVLRYRGVDVHPHVIRSVLTRTPEIFDYRIRQTPRGVDIEALTVAPLDCDLLAERLVRALAGAGLPDPVVGVRAVDDLERLPDSGKLRRLVPMS